MALELKDYIQPITEYIKDDEETIKEFKRYLLAVIMSDTLQNDYVTSLNIRDITNNFVDDNFNDFIHGVLHIQAKGNNSPQALDRIRMKRILVDTLTLMGTTTDYKYLTMQNSRSVIDNCHISADNLLTDEAEVDKIFTSFDLTVQEQFDCEDYKRFKQAYDDRNIHLQCLDNFNETNKTEQDYIQLGYTIADELLRYIITRLNTNALHVLFSYYKTKQKSDIIISKESSAWLNGIDMFVSDGIKCKFNILVEVQNISKIYDGCISLLEATESVKRQQ